MLMLMAYGPNDIEAPCRFFEDQAQADVLIARWMTPEFVRPHSYKGRTLWRVDKPDADHMESFYEALFTTYYGGCGEASAFELKPLPINQPCMTWNLD